VRPIITPDPVAKTMRIIKGYAIKPLVELGSTSITKRKTATENRVATPPRVDPVATAGKNLIKRRFLFSSQLCNRFRD
jgi:hypothetical protein